MPTAELPDVALHYEWSGPDTAPVLVFSNSLGTNLHMWDAQIADFGKHFRILRYDTRGHGQSSVTPGPYSIEQLSNDVVGLLDALHLAKVHFCGLSMGGMTGIFLGAHFANRFHKIVLCSTAANIGTAETWNARIAGVKEGGMKSIGHAVIDRWFTPQFRAAHPAEIATMQVMVENANPEGYIANCAAVRDAHLGNSLADFKVPALVVSGTQDPATPPADGRYLAQGIPNSRFLEVSAAHISNIEAQAVFNREVLSFLLS